MATSIGEHFSVIPDPRVDRTKLHKREDILVMVLCAVICGAETGGDLVDWAKALVAGRPTLRTLPHGIPAHDTCGRVLAALDGNAFERAFQSGGLDGAGTSQG